MSRRVVIDSLAFAREGGSLQGELPVSSLVRVLDMLADPAGELAGLRSPRQPSLVDVGLDQAVAAAVGAA